MLKRYGSYKDSGVQWIGEIPKHWNVSKLKFSDLIVMGQSPNSEDCNSEGIGLPFLQGNAEFGLLYPTAKLFCECPNKKALENDVLLSVRAPIGAVNLASQTIGIGRGLCAIRAVNSNPKFLYYYTLFFSEELNSLGTGSTFKAVTVEDVKNICIPISSYSEQTQIAQYLDDKTSQIDKLITDKEKLIKLLNEERTAIINQAVTKGLNPDVPMKDSGIEWLGKVPEHWKIKKLKYLCSVISEKRADFKPEVIIALENIESWTGRIIGSLDINDVGSDLSLFRQGDVLFNKLRPYLAKAVLARHDGACVGELLVLRSTSEIIPEFLFRRMLSETFISIIDGSTFGTKMPRASWDKFISQLEVPICGIDEQRDIVLFISNQEKRIDNLLEKTRQEIELLKEYKTALISEVVTGKVDVRDEVIAESTELVS